jgi:hypothetical protein
MHIPPRNRRDQDSRSSKYCNPEYRAILVCRYLALGTEGRVEQKLGAQCGWCGEKL